MAPAASPGATADATATQKTKAMMTTPATEITQRKERVDLFAKPLIL